MSTRAINHGATAPATHAIARPMAPPSTPTRAHTSEARLPSIAHRRPPVLVVTAPHQLCLWEGLQTLLRALPERPRVSVRELWRPARLLMEVRTLRPTLIFLPLLETLFAPPPEPVDGHAVPSVGRPSGGPDLATIHRASPSSRLLLLSEDVPPAATVRRLSSRPAVAGLLRWSDITPAVLAMCMRLSHTRSIRLASASVVVAMLGDAADSNRPDARTSAAPAPMTARTAARAVSDQAAMGIYRLSQREQEVLGGLASGRTEAQLAMVLNVSARTVRRIVGHIESQLEAPTMFLLGLRTAQLGLL